MCSVPGMFIVTKHIISLLYEEITVAIIVVKTIDQTITDLPR